VGVNPVPEYISAGELMRQRNAEPLLRTGFPALEQLVGGLGAGQSYLFYGASSFIDDLVHRLMVSVSAGGKVAYMNNTDYYSEKTLVRPDRIAFHAKRQGLDPDFVLELFKTGMDSYFLFPLELFAKSERRRRMNLRKFYIVDTGYATALGYEFSIGRAMENSVMLELRRREKEVFYWKEYGKTQGKEVDFVVSKNNSPEELLQVTYTEEGMHAREMNALNAREK
jgi:hypothetical protein